MSRFEPLMEDVKRSNSAALPADKDVEGGSPPPPSYPLHETEELVVGGPGSRFPRFVHWIRARRNRRHGCGGCRVQENGGRTMCRKALRAVKFIFVMWMILSLVHLVGAGITAYKTMKSMKCMAIIPGEHLDGLTITVPVGHSKHILVHDSLFGGDAVITHDETIAKGTVQFAVTFANDTKLDAVYDGCVTNFRRATAVGLIPRAKHGERAKISTFSIHLPASFPTPSVRFLGSGDKHISDRKLQKFIRWWRKRHDKKEDNKPIENAT